MERMRTSQILAAAVAADVTMCTALTTTHAPAPMRWALVAMTGLTAAGTIAAHHNESHG